MELEHALEAGCAVIVIEPDRLAEVTQRWIIVGNALHKIAVYSGIASIITGIHNRHIHVVSYVMLHIDFIIDVECFQGLYVSRWRAPRSEYSPCSALVVIHYPGRRIRVADIKRKQIQSDICQY